MGLDPQTIKAFLSMANVIQIQLNNDVKEIDQEIKKLKDNLKRKEGEKNKAISRRDDFKKMQQLMSDSNFLENSITEIRTHLPIRYKGLGTEDLVMIIFKEKVKKNEEVNSYQLLAYANEIDIYKSRKALYSAADRLVKKGKLNKVNNLYYKANV